MKEYFKTLSKVAIGTFLGYTLAIPIFTFLGILDFSYVLQGGYSYFKWDGGYVWISGLLMTILLSFIVSVIIISSVLILTVVYFLAESLIEDFSRPKFIEYDGKKRKVLAKYFEEKGLKKVVIFLSDDKPAPNLHYNKLSNTRREVSLTTLGKIQAIAIWIVIVVFNFILSVLTGDIKSFFKGEFEEDFGMDDYLKFKPEEYSNYKADSYPIDLSESKIKEFYSRKARYSNKKYKANPYVYSNDLIFIVTRLQTIGASNSYWDKQKKMCIEKQKEMVKSDNKEWIDVE